MYESTDTIISGINKWYPPVSSAIRNIPVSGACITPDISPAIPTSAKLANGSWHPAALRSIATTYPLNAPTNNEGANIPPTPPPPLVATLAKILSITTILRYATSSHSVLHIDMSGLPNNVFCASPLISSVMDS